jgi:hypothetical protein
MFGSSILVKLTKNGHRHNGVVRKAGDKIRVPDDVAIAMRGRGECDYVTGKELTDERDAARAKQAARVNKEPSAKPKNKNRQ